MRLSDLSIKPSYTKTDDDIAEEFYLPCMRCSNRYDRISGYFGSTIYIIAWDALKEFIESGGHMRLICSPYISDEDERAMSRGYSARHDVLLADSLRAEMDNLFSQAALSAPATLLAYMIAEDIIDIRIAAIDSGMLTADVRRMFHDKVGIFKDTFNNAVGFRGSMNETYKGLSSDGNIESIDAFPSWLGERDAQRLTDAATLFNRLWENSVPNISVYKFPDAVRSILKEKAKGCNWRELLSEIQVTETDAKRWSADKRTGAKKPRKHQVDALKAWEKNGRRGILEHATGSGKTYTAICAIRNSLEKGETVLVLVPSIALLVQWKNEIEANMYGITVDFLLCGDVYTEWKRDGVLAAWTAPSHKHRIILASMDTASNFEFIKRIVQGDHLFLVADEMHRLGSPKRRNILSIVSGPRLGLSATPRRYGDPEGTKVLLDYFGGIIEPPYTLMDAINSGVLTRYFYYPQKIRLSMNEQEEWNEITNRIRLMIARSAGDDTTRNAIFQSPAIKKLLIKRARIVKNATEKVALALKVIRDNYQDWQKWIIYCDNILQLRQVLDILTQNGFNAYEYYAEMEGDRQETLSYFSLNGGILVSIKCLDEGVDIPSATHALVLASSQNPREFIQRRGRILRKSKGKHYAYLYDAVTVPFIAEEENEKSLSIIEAELSRAIEFGEGAENPSCIADLKVIALEYGIDYTRIKDGGFEEDE